MCLYLILENSKIFSTNSFHSIDWKSKEKLELKQSETKEPVKIDLIKEDGNFSYPPRQYAFYLLHFHDWARILLYHSCISTHQIYWPKSLSENGELEFNIPVRWGSTFDQIGNYLSLSYYYGPLATSLRRYQRSPFLIQWCIYMYVFWLTSVSSQRFTVGLTPLEYIVQLLWQRLLAASSCCSHHGAAFSLIFSMIKLKAKLEYVSVIHERALIRNIF